MEIYLDNASTTKLDEDVFNEMQNCLDEYYGNHDSPHHLGLISLQKVKESRENVAELMDVDDPNSICFTSSGSEANTWAITKVKPFDNKNRIVSTKVEHPSIYLSLKDTENTLLDVDNYGLISLDNLENELKKEDVYLVSIQFVNSETGVIQPIEEISALCKKYGALLHVDACQAFGKIKFSTEDLEIDFLSVSAHKIYGPKGIGALYIKDKTTIEPLIYGAYQEGGLRGGTLNIALIVGFGEACRKSRIGIIENAKAAEILTEHAFGLLNLNNEGVKRNGKKENSSPYILSISIKGIEATSIVSFLSKEYGVCISCGPKHKQEPSYVLRAMGKSITECHSTIRISVSKNLLHGNLVFATTCIQIAVDKDKERNII